MYFDIGIPNQNSSLNKNPVLGTKSGKWTSYYPDLFREIQYIDRQ